MTSAVHCQLWMGSLEHYMTENFIIAAFRKMGEEPTTVRLMRNKYTGEPAGYCFVNFPSDDHALDAMHKLNGKPIPGTNPIVRFRLNSASNSYKLPGNEREFSVWVGDLSSDVDDYQLYKVFSTKYTSIKTAKVILDSLGFSKGYGFVRFGIEDEQKSALYDMNGFVGLGSKPIKICTAVPKPKSELGVALGNGTQNNPSGIASAVGSNYGYGGSHTTSTTVSTTDYSQYYDPNNTVNYWQGYNAWQGYYDQSGGGGGATSGDMTNLAYYQQQQAAALAAQQNASHSNPQTLAQHAEAWSAQRNAQYEQQSTMSTNGTTTTNPESGASSAIVTDDDYALVEHKSILDVDKLNREALDADRHLYDALESSKWLPIEQLEVF